MWNGQTRAVSKGSLFKDGYGTAAAQSQALLPETREQSWASSCISLMHFARTLQLAMSRIRVEIALDGKEVIRASSIAVNQDFPLSGQNSFDLLVAKYFRL